MFLLNSAYVLVLINYGVKDVHTQMDVSLMVPQLSPNIRLTPDVSDSLSESDEFGKNFQSIEDEVRRMHEMIDTEINKNFRPFQNSRNPNIPHITTERIGSILGDMSNSDSSDGDEDNPLLDLMKFVGSSLQGPLITSAGSDNQKNKRIYLNDEGDENGELSVPVFTIIRLDDDFTPLRPNATSQVGDLESSSFFQGFLSSFVDTMRDMVDLLRNSSTTLRADEDNIQRFNQPSGIEIIDHGRTYEVPPSEFVNRSFPFMVNITWRSSDLKEFNNSLSMNVSKDRDGVILLDHIRMRISNDGVIQEYERKIPVRMEESNPNIAEITLGDGVDLRFIHPNSLDGTIKEKKAGRFSVQWMAISIALLGLIVAGLVMLLSYILHAKNRNYSRKDSMYKEPMA